MERGQQKEKAMAIKEHGEKVFFLNHDSYFTSPHSIDEIAVQWEWKSGQGTSYLETNWKFGGKRKVQSDTQIGTDRKRYYLQMRIFGESGTSEKLNSVLV